MKSLVDGMIGRQSMNDGQVKQNKAVKVRFHCVEIALAVFPPFNIVRVPREFVQKHPSYQFHGHSTLIHTLPFIKSILFLYFEERSKIEDLKIYKSVSLYYSPQTN